MNLAGEYALAGRQWVLERIRKIVGGNVVDTVHNHHNFGFLENHNGKNLYVVRKGATPAFPGQRGYVGGSMVDDAVIIEGVDSPESRESFYSTVHGAGRLVGRKQAKRQFTRERMDQLLRDKGVLLSGGGLDESGDCYRKLSDVIAAQGATIKVLHRLRPVAVAMAGEIEDPWKD
jgi:tRNA-splicing ligase RtcB